MTTIYYGQGDQAIRIVPVDRLARRRVVDSATVAVYDAREPENGSRRVVLAETSATVASGTSTLAANAGPSAASPRRLTLSTISGVTPGRSYRLRSLTGDISEVATVESVNGIEATLTRALTRQFEPGASVVEVGLSATFPAAVADDELRLANGGGPFTAVWNYEIDGEVFNETRDLWLTRYGVAPWVTPDEVLSHLPGYAQQLGESVSMRAAILAATDDYLEHMETSGADPTTVSRGRSATLGVRKMALCYALRGTRTESSTELASTYEDAARKHWNNITEGRLPVRTAVLDDDDMAEPGGDSDHFDGFFSRS